MRRPFLPLAGCILAIAILLWGCSSGKSADPMTALAQGGTPSALAPASVSSPMAKPASMADLAVYEGADRFQLLTEGAKKEGSLTVYTSRTQEDIDRILSPFEKKYGIKVNVWRAASDNVLQKATTEAKAGKNDFDIVDISGIELEAMHREKVLQEVKSPYFADLISQAIPKHREWVATSLNLFVHAYNTSLVKKEDLPKKYEDLLDPKWKGRQGKGRLGIEAGDSDFFSVIVREMGEEKGLKFWRDLVAANGLDVRKGHTLLTNLVRSGEVPFAITVYNFTAEQYKKEGSPLDWYVMEPAVARPNGIGVAKKAPHPNASLLFYDYMLSEGQQEMVKLDFMPVNKKVESAYSKINVKIIDPATLLDERDKWNKLFDDIVIKRVGK
jgi:iron(III) transport system substrate-binding protein